MGALNGHGVLAVWNDIAADDESEYNDWYTNQHLPERVNIEGFHRGRRFRRVSTDPGQRYFTLYEVENTDTLSSQAYIERLDNPTNWTAKVAPRFVNTIRTACTTSVSVGAASGGHGLTVEFGAVEGRENDLRTWLKDKAFPELIDDADIVSAHLFESDLGATSAKDSTAESAAMSDRPATLVRWFVLVEATSVSGCNTARELLSAAALSEHGADPEAQLGTFQLLVELEHGA